MLQEVVENVSATYDLTHFNSLQQYRFAKELNKPLTITTGPSVYALFLISSVAILRRLRSRADTRN